MTTCKLAICGHYAPYTLNSIIYLTKINDSNLIKFYSCFLRVVVTLHAP